MKTPPSGEQLSDKRIVALLTGRGGSSLPDKNVIPVLGKPLLYYPAKAARESAFVGEWYASSDDEKILAAAAAAGYLPIQRPAEFSRPDSQHGDVIRHALGFLRENGKSPDILVVVLANCVAIKTKWIDDCISAMLADDAITAVAPVYADSDHHPYRAKKIAANGFLEPFFDFAGKKISTNRQDLEASYFFCHNFWVLRASNLDTDAGQLPWTFMGDTIKPYVITEKTVDVHEKEDVAESEQWLREHAA